MRIVLLTSLFLALCMNAKATTYYLNANTGNDQNNGRSAERAWRSLAKVNALQLVPGDQIILAEGGEFTGSLKLQVKDGDTPGRNIVIRSSGPRLATIISPDQSAISAEVGGIAIRDLILKGNATKHTKDHNGITFFTANKTGRRYPNVRIENLEITGFGDAGISLGSGDNSLPGYDNVRITRVKAHDNYSAGIISFDKPNDRTKGYAHRNVLVQDCVFSNNHGGTGIVLSGIENGLVQYCLASDNEGPGGGVGIWAYWTKNVRFRYCIANGTRTRGKDGGGFDLDGACINCTIEHCLAYENDGPGYMHCDYPTAGQTQGNRIVSSISINDGRYKDKNNPLGFGFVTWGSGLDDCHISNTLTVITEDNPSPDAGGALFVAYLPGYGGKDDVAHIQGCTATNNLVVISGKGYAQVASDLPKATVENVRFEKNSYRLAETVKPLFVWNDQKYSSLEAWRTATGQEKMPPTLKDSSLPPVTPAEYRLTDPRALPRFFLMKFLPRPAKK